MVLKNGKIWLLTLGLALLAGLAFLYAHPGNQVRAVYPVRGPAVQGVYATGTVEPTVMLPLAPRVAGRLVALLADEGARVEKGQVLARLEDEDLQQSLAELQARADLAKSEFERQQALRAREFASVQAFDQARAAYEAARAAAERVQAQLEYLKLIAPETGTIIRRDGEIGELIATGQPVFWLSCCNGLRIEAEVDEEDIAFVAPGQKAVIRADAFPDRIFTGTVGSITPMGDPVSRSYRVRVSLPPDTPLMIGMTAETNIVIREDENALLVPAGALRDKNTLIVYRNGRYQEARVKTGAVTPAVVEISEGLTEKDQVVVDARMPPDDYTQAPVIERWERGRE